MKKYRFSRRVFAGLFLTGVLIGATDFFYRAAIQRYKQTVEIDNVESFFNSKQIMQTQSWLNKQKVQTIHMQATDGVQLAAGYVSAQENTKKCVILAHGYRGSRSEMYGFARLYAEDYHCHVLLPDARGHGESEGTYVGLGWHDRLDILRWIEYVVCKLGEEVSIVLHGLSMGGATVLMTSGESLPKQVRAIVSDCAYTTASGILSHRLQEMYRLPPFPMLHLASIYTKWRSGYSFFEASALKQIQKSKVPILLIHSELDELVPVEMSYSLNDAGKDKTELLVIRGALHGRAYAHNPARFETTLRQFLKKSL